MLGAFPSGLVIYWTWNNTLSVIQQYFIMRRNGVKVELWDNLTKLFAKSAAQGADTEIWLAASDEVKGVSGKFFDNRKEIACKFRDPAGVEKLWGICEAQLARPAMKASA